MEEETLGTVVLVEEPKDGLLWALVVLLHVVGQVAGERHRAAGQQQDGKDPQPRSASKEKPRLIFTKDLREPYQRHTGPPSHQEATAGQGPEGHLSHLDAEDRGPRGGLKVK